MEVHHHPQLKHEPKPWKEYLLESLMIFIAVTMGFFAESIREGISDSAKENEYIKSMIEDARTDTAAIHWCIRLNSEKLKVIDSLMSGCFNYDASKKSDAILYIEFKKGTNHPDYANPVERTLTQLKNSGGMRLIRKKEAVDSIIAYDDEAKKLLTQQLAYEHYLDNWAELSEQIFNLRYAEYPDSKLAALKTSDIIYNDLLLTRDKKTLTRAGNSVGYYGGVVGFYTYRLKETEVHAVNLIRTLQREYHLKGE